MNRILYDLPREQYEALPGERWTVLKEMAESAAHYKHARENPERESDMTPEHLDLLRRGAAGHVAVLEPEKYGGHDPGAMPMEPDGTLYGWWPEANKNRSSNDFKSFASACARTGRTPIRERDHLWCQRLAHAVRSNPAAAKYLEGPREVSIQWEHIEPTVGGLEGFRIPVKGRIDKVATRDGKPFAIVDLKSTRSARPDRFGAQAFHLMYHGQAAEYVDGYEACTGIRLPFVWIAVAEKPPHNVVVYRARPMDLELGRHLYRDLLQRVHACRKSGEWPGYAQGEMELELPAYAYGEENIEEEAA